MDDTPRDLLVAEIDLPPENMRTTINRDTIFELGEDIKRNGLINPIMVRPKGERYEVVAGQRRLLAHHYTGIASIKAIVRSLDDSQAFAIMTSENNKREDVPLLDQVTHATRALAHCGGDIDAAAKMVGESKYWLETRLAIAQMPERLQDALRNDKIKIGVAFALHKITDDTDQQAVLELCITQGASIVMANYYVAQWEAGLFGHALNQTLPDSDMPSGERNVVTLRDAIDGKDYPATEMVTVLTRRENLVYIDGLRQHLQADAAKAASTRDNNSVVDAPAPVADAV